MYKRIQEKTLEEISKQQHPFDDDLLKRKNIADTFVNIILNTQGPYVYNINSPYGTGKTFFLKRLKVLLEKQNIATVFYSSWENDYFDNPLISITQEITAELTECKKNFKEKFKNISKRAIAGITTVANTLVRLTCPPANMILNMTDEAISKLPKESFTVSNYKDLKEEKEKFKNKLTEITKNNQLVIIIDDLDRCRPDYAVKMLETIKHFFNIPNTIFILATDRSQIESAISVLYGKKIENKSSEYLRKFIDYDLYLQQPDNESFIELLINQHLIDVISPFCQLQLPAKSYPIYAIEGLQGKSALNYVKDTIRETLKFSFNYFNFSLRAQEQIAVKLKIFISALDPKTDLLIPELAAWIVCFHSFNEEFCNQFIYNKEKKTKEFLIGNFNETVKNISDSVFYDYALNHNINPSALKDLPKLNNKFTFNETIDFYFGKGPLKQQNELMINIFKYTEILNLIKPETRENYYSFLRRAGFL